MPVSGSVGDAGICSWGFSCPPRTLPLDAARSGGYPHNSRNGHSSKTNLFSVDEAAFAVPTRDLSCDFCDFIRTFFDWNGTYRWDQNFVMQDCCYYLLLCLYVLVLSIRLRVVSAILAVMVRNSD